MVTAYVNITVPAKQSGGVVEKLKKWDEVKEAAAVYGQTDVVAKIEVESLSQVDQVVMEKIQGLKEVELTRTFVAIDHMHWKR